MRHVPLELLTQKESVATLRTIPVEHRLIANLMKDKEEYYQVESDEEEL